VRTGNDSLTRYTPKTLNPSPDKEIAGTATFSTFNPKR
jgi:hypothetical protein